MNNIIQFKSGGQGAGFSLENEILALTMHLKRLVRSGESLFQKSDLGLADQVLTHALIAAGTSFGVSGEEGSPGKSRETLASITYDRYGVEIGTDGSAPADAYVLVASDLLKHWPEDALVQYVLDHEVPVDPRDMPGAEGVKLAG